MHPEILRELGSQRRSEMRARAERVTLVRMARRNRRAGRGAADADVVVAPAIPDFVDGSFLAGAAEEPAGRHAA